MNRTSFFTLAATTLLWVASPAGQAAPYFPYETIDNYYKPQPAPPVPPPPAVVQPAEQPAKAPPQVRRPAAVTQPPEFLFPAKLGFGVAVGVPYDMMYLSKTFYYWSDGSWYSSPSYRGPWTPLAYSQLPTELRKNRLATIRGLRNEEFRSYWKNPERYQGRRFKPDGGMTPPAKEERR